MFELVGNCPTAKRIFISVSQKNQILKDWSIGSHAINPQWAKAQEHQTEQGGNTGLGSYTGDPECDQMKGINVEETMTSSFTTEICEAFTTFKILHSRNRFASNMFSSLESMLLKITDERAEKST